MGPNTSAARVVALVLAIGLLAIPLGRALVADAPFPEALDRTELLLFGGAGLAVMVLVWTVFGPVPARRRAFRGAPTALATVVATRTTGREVNDQPELELTLDIDLPDGSTRRGTAREVVPHDQLVLVTVGSRVPVVHLPDGRAAITLEVDAQAAREIEDGFHAAQQARGVLTAQQVQVARSGSTAQAVVLSAEPTGEIAHGKAVIAVQLEVTRPDGARFRAQRQLPLSPQALSRLAPGAVTEVRYLPGDESFVAVNVRTG